MRAREAKTKKIREAKKEKKKALGKPRDSSGKKQPGKIYRKGNYTHLLMVIYVRGTQRNGALNYKLFEGEGVS